MPDKKNALAELAKELERFVAENKGLFASRNHLILHKAQRIVAELAKCCKDYEDNYGARGYYISCRDAFENCRAIAEEGAGDGK